MLCVTLASTRMARSQQAYLEDRRHGRIRPTRLVRRRVGSRCAHTRAKHLGCVVFKVGQVKSSQVTLNSNMTKLVQNPCKLQRTCTENPQKNVGCFVRFKFTV